MRFLIFVAIVLFSCSDSTSKDSKSSPGELISRRHNEYRYLPEKNEKLKPEPYPWEKPLVGNFPSITKEFFRCKGSSLNPVRVYHNGKETARLYDCGGSEKHSLPLRDGKEFVYPILIELLNYIQAQTGKHVVITSGHRCPEHNAYSDPTKENQYSKHMVGAEVSFYLQGWEGYPSQVVTLIQQYYKEKYTNADFTEFHRYEKSDTNVSTPPWYNKEVFVKLFKANEGRDMDNRHPYPYLAIQVRYDPEKNTRVLYNWNEAHKNYLRK